MTLTEAIIDKANRARHEGNDYLANLCMKLLFSKKSENDNEGFKYCPECDNFYLGSICGCCKDTRN